MSLEIDPDIYDKLWGLFRKPRPFAIISESGAYPVGLIHRIDDPEELEHVFQAKVRFRARRGDIHEVPIANIRQLQVKETA